MAPVARALAAQGIVPRLIFTGQHDLIPHAFGLDAWPQVTLNCPGLPHPQAHVQTVMSAMLAQLRPAPDLLLVQGDTSSALGGALAGFRLGIPVAHVEAGLRTHDPLLPWPEEEYRTVIDRHAALLFAPTETSAANLEAEGVSGEIFVTGNTAIDAILEARSRVRLASVRDGDRPRLLVTCHRRENWQDGLRSIAVAVTRLADEADVDFILHPNPFVAGEARRLLSGVPVSLVNPCGHDELLKLMLRADVILSDSGGIQEEAPALGVPLLILREKTERPECIQTGNAILVGTDSERIVSAALHLLQNPTARAAMSRPRFPFGDGHSGERIATLIVEWLQQRSLTRGFA